MRKPGSYLREEGKKPAVNIKDGAMAGRMKDANSVELKRRAQLPGEVKHAVPEK